MAVGFVANYAAEPTLTSCAVPRVFISSTRDEFAPKERLEEMIGAAPEPKKLIFVDSEDHFFKGALDEFEKVVRENAA
jgi:alpha/beta superfamily hydrolase